MSESVLHETTQPGRFVHSGANAVPPVHEHQALERGRARRAQLAHGVDVFLPRGYRVQGGDSGGQGSRGQKATRVEAKDEERARGARGADGKIQGEAGEEEPIQGALQRRRRSRHGGERIPDHHRRHEGQSEIQGALRRAAERDLVGRTARHGEDALGESRRRRSRVAIFLRQRFRVCGDVRRRRRESHAQPVQARA